MRVPVFSSFLLFITFTFVRSQFPLRAEVVARLPSQTYGTSAVYNGLDSIYIFGQSIFKLGISSKTLVQVGQVPFLNRFQSVQFDTEGNIFFFVGSDSAANSSTVWKFDTTTENFNPVAYLPHNIQECGTVKQPGSNIVHVFSSNEGRIVAFDMSTLSSTLVGQIPRNFGHLDAARFGNSAYLFGPPVGYFFPETKRVMKVNLESMDVSLGLTDFPEITGRGTAVAVGESIYVMGGYLTNWATPTLTGGIVKLNPNNYQYDYIEVENFPVGGDRMFQYAPESVYVESIDSIFMIGGYSTSFAGGAGVTYDEIWQIKLSDVPEPSTITTVQTTTEDVTTTGPPETTTSTPETTTASTPPVSSTTTAQPPSTTTTPPSTTTEVTETPEVEPSLGTGSTTIATSTQTPGIETCENMPNGFYPHPVQCSWYIVCIDEGMTIYRCPIPQLFNPSTGQCDHPDNVQCLN